MDKNAPTRTYRLSRTRHVLSKFAMVAALSACMLSATTNSYAIDFGSDKVVNLGGGFTVPIIDNDGQLSSSVNFVAPGPTGNTVYFYNNGEIGLALRGYNGGANSFTTISHVDANAAAFSAGNTLASHTHYLGGSGSTLPTNIDNYGYVSASSMYEGVSARFEVSGRQLIGTYEVEAGSTTAAIRLSFSDIDGTSLDESTGDISITLTSGRVVQLHAARVAVGGGEIVYVPFALDNNEPVLDLSGIVSETETVTITVKMTFGPYYHDYEAVADEGNGIVAVSTAFNTMTDGASNSGADIIITRLNEAGTEVVSTTIVAGENDDVGYSVALADASAVPCGGRLYVAGSTKSSSFPAEGQREGMADAYILRLNSDATAVQSGTIMSASGRDVAHHVIICGCDVIVVGATDGGLAEVNKSGLSFSTRFPVVAASDKVQEYYLAVLNSDATTVSNRIAFEGPAIGMPLRAACAGGSIQVGVENGNMTTADCNYTTEMSPWFDTPCRTSNAASPHWGLHAMCWKAATSLTHTMKPSWSGVGNLAPAGAVYTGHEDDLNDLEENQSITCFNCYTNCNYGPFGVWHGNRYDNYASTQTPPTQGTRVAELAIGAAFYQKKFDSPVYANWVFDSHHLALLIRKVYMKVTDLNGNAANLEDICSTQWSAATGDLFDMSCMIGVNSTGHIVVCSMDVVPWHPQQSQPVPNHYPLENWDANTLLNNISDWSVYIADPPDDQPQIASQIQEASSQLARTVLAAADLEIVTYTNGVAEESSTTSTYIRLAAFHAPGQPAALPTSVEEQRNGQSVSASFGSLASRPNPASGEISVTYQVHDAAVVRLEIYDAMGQKVGVVDEGYRQPREYSARYDTSTLAVGTYYLRLSSDSGVLTMPLLVVR